MRKSELKHLMKEVGKLPKKERERIEEGEVVNLQQQLNHEKRQRRLLQRQVSDLICVFICQHTNVILSFLLYRAI